MFGVGTPRVVFFTLGAAIAAAVVFRRDLVKLPRERGARTRLLDPFDDRHGRGDGSMGPQHVPVPACRPRREWRLSRSAEILRGLVAVGALYAVAALGVALLASTPALAAGSNRDIARGVVTDNGVPVPGATVHAYLWPNGPTLDGLPVGAQVPTFSVNSTTTDPAGRYYVPMRTPGSIPAMYQEAHGAVNLEVDVIVSGRYMVTGGSVVYNSAAGVWQNAETGTRITTGSGEVLDFGSGTARDTSPTPPADQGDAAVDTGPMRYHGDPVAAGAGTCTWSVGTMHYGQPEHFMNVNSWTYAKGTVLEGSASTHTLGIGVTSNGFATLKAGPAVTLALSSDTGNVVSQGGLVNEAVFNTVNSRDFSLVCPLGLTADGRRRPVSTYAFLDSTLEHHITHTAYFASVQGMQAPGRWSTTTAHAATLRHGLDLGPISVNAQSGYNASTDLTFHFSKDGFIGGNNLAGTHQSSKVDARSYK
jgi:hypothetical protein